MLIDDRLGFWQYIIDKMPILINGIKTSYLLFFAVLLIAAPLSVLAAVAKVSGPRAVRALLNLYTWAFRGSPLVLQLSLVYYGFPYLGIVWQPWTVALVVFSLSFAAYETEVIRGGIISVEKGQYEACRVLGMNFFQTMRRVVVPQAIRRVLPPTCSEVIILFKDTSLVTSIALMDMMRTAQRIVIMDLRIDAFIAVLAIYLLMASLTVSVFHRLERILNASVLKEEGS
ncbi:MAG: amino acid ABC transporter permease [Clostridiales bacterium]|nr:amino acid ABC transporter permease [Clostridiales bacterium]